MHQILKEKHFVTDHYTETNRVPGFLQRKANSFLLKKKQNTKFLKHLNRFCLFHNKAFHTP